MRFLNFKCLTNNERKCVSGGKRLNMYQIATRKNGKNVNSSLEENGQMLNVSGEIRTAIFGGQPQNLEYTMLNHIDAHLAPEQQNELLAPNTSAKIEKIPGLDGLTYNIRNFLTLKNELVRMYNEFLENSVLILSRLFLRGRYNTYTQH
jgi:hypothetical protein